MIELIKGLAGLLASALPFKRPKRTDNLKAQVAKWKAAEAQQAKVVPIKRKDLN